MGKTAQQLRFEAAWLVKWPNDEPFIFKQDSKGQYTWPEVQDTFEGFQLGEASGLERAVAECERLSTAIDNAGKTYNRDTTSTHCALAIRALMAQGET
jgi:hypothetical protein